MTITIAFSNARRVMMSRGLRSSSSSRYAAATDFFALAELGGILGRNGRGIRQRHAEASIALAIVFAVYMPPQGMAPGIEQRPQSRARSSVIALGDRRP
ncbi:MAG: hypothetical protein U0992_21210 [Planctomycetaceae bacterium]